MTFVFDQLTVWNAWAMAVKLITYWAAFLAIGTTLYVIATPGLVADIRKSARRIILASALIAAVAALARIGIQAGRLLDEGMAGVTDPEMLELVIDGPLGTSVFLRFLGLVTLAAFALSIPVSWLFGLLGAILTASSFSFVGHGSEEPRLLMGSLVTLHLLGISFWIGAFWPLRQASGNSATLATAADMAHRFGQQAAWIVPALVVAGGILALRIAGSPEALLATQYGWTLLLKILGVSLLLGLAAANKLRFVPAMKKGDVASARHLRHSIALETLAVTAILIVTAVLTTITPLPQNM